MKIIYQILLSWGIPLGLTYLDNKWPYLAPATISYMTLLIVLLIIESLYRTGLARLGPICVVRTKSDFYKQLFKSIGFFLVFVFVGNLLAIGGHPISATLYICLVGYLFFVSRPYLKVETEENQ